MTGVRVNSVESAYIHTHTIITRPCWVNRSEPTQRHSTSITQVDSWWKAEKLTYKVLAMSHLWLAKVMFELPLREQSFLLFTTDAKL